MTDRDDVHLDRLNGCARCLSDSHDDITFHPLTNPIEIEDLSDPEPLYVFTHWALCPTNGEPILMTAFDLSEPT